MPRYLLGVDAGSTVTKSVLFDEEGNEIASASRRVPHSVPHPHQVERDQDDVWDAVCETIRGAIAGVAPAEIAAVAVTSHGDGIYLVDAAGRPIRPGILSLDTRAAPVVREWEAGGVSDRLLGVSGQRPWPGSPISVLTWLARHEPSALDRAAFALPGKDAIKQRLTGEFSTDLTESTLSFANVNTQRYDDEILSIAGGDAFRRLLPPVLPSASIAGRVTRAASEATGLAVGTIVAAGAHDVDCGAIGIGAARPGQLAVIAGTFSINELISDTVVIDERWNARAFVEQGLWMNMALSPASATNVEWFVQRLAPLDLERGRLEGEPFGFVEREIAAIENDPSEIVYAPFLYGSPFAEDASGSFIGMRGWHERGHLLRAVMEGVVFNHRQHVDALRSGFDVTDIRLTGGATASARWTQLFADALGTPIALSGASEATALGCALLAGIASGAYRDLGDAVGVAEKGMRSIEPDAAGVARADDAYDRYVRTIDALRPIWGENTGPSGPVR